MDENKLQFGVGVLVVSSIGIGIILTFLFGAFPSVLNDDYILLVAFPSAEGISSNTPVLRDGVPIGRVAEIKLRQEGGVLVTLAMKRDKQLTHEYVPRIGSGNFVTGDAKLEFVRGESGQLESIFDGDSEIIKKPLTDGQYMDYGSKTASLFDMQSDLQTSFAAIRDAGQSIAAAGQNVDQLAVEVRQIVDGTDDRIDDVSRQTAEAMEEFQAAIRDVRAIIGDPENQANLKASLAQLPRLLNDARLALESTQQTFESFERVGNRFERVGMAAEETIQGAQRVVINADQTFDNLERFTAPLAEGSDELVGQVMQTLTSLDRTLVQVEKFGAALNDSDGTVKRLLEDDELYYQLRRTVENIERATASLHPIMDDVRIFTDKIARDPRELGVRGALTRRPSGMGLK